MLGAKLVRFLWVLVLVNGALVPLAIYGESMKRHRALAIAFQLAPFLFPVLCVGVFFLVSHVDRTHRERLLATGVEAPAIVLEVRDPGIEVGVDPVLTALVRVTPHGTEPFDSEVAFAPSRLDMGRVRAGTTLTVRYDPKDRSRIAVEAITSVTIP